MNEAVQSDFRSDDLDAGDLPGGRDRRERALVAALALATAQTITVPAIEASVDRETRRILPGAPARNIVISAETAELMRRQIVERAGSDIDFKIGLPENSGGMA